ncbi:carbohydrate-binding module family 14 protein [Pseudoalteromonas sp. MMG022]|uniref:carbohydrate-binding module family 14 protein n=1 Tax=Pseudoalteromonas sp. MMG022 TaxID=2909978 RepID=UPI001F3FD663|nr:carbohydrate-binding module family 14 protein [Pseudoalteromonas sp. MMG022]MCF6434060.1 carbohydrate-binding module family 14 protein [Pseudoalteromonas sp. MMG022]
MVNFIYGSIKSAALLLCVGYICNGYTQTPDNTVQSSQITVQSTYIEVKNGSTMTQTRQFQRPKARDLIQVAEVQEITECTDIGKFSHPDCTKYYHCVTVGNAPYIMSCGSGLFWDKAGYCGFVCNNE